MDLNREIRSLIAEINQAGDRNISVLEDRIAQLSELVDKSDRQIDDARMMLEYLDSRSGFAAMPPAGAPPAAAPAPEPEPAASEPPASEPPASEPAESPEEDREDGDTRDTVLTLYRQGLSQDLIASRTGIAIGEVELIISLQGQRTWR